MNVPHEFGTKQRILLVLTTLLDYAEGRTKKQLAQQMDVSLDTIKKDIEAIKNAGFVVEQDKRYRYHLQPNRPYRQLKDILHFSEEDQALLHDAIDQLDPGGKRGEKLKKKLSSLYDYRQLGHTYMKAPYLNKVDVLRQAMEQERMVILHAYRSSNSDQVSDRRIEPFHLEPAEDILHAFDHDRMAVRHFKISRFTRIKVLKDSFQYQQQHHVSHTDVFRVVENRTVRVHLRLKVGGYNALVEQFPLARAYVQPSAEAEGEYDFEAPVNYRFIGLTNFALGNYHHLVEVVSPDALIDHLREAAESFLLGLRGGR